MVNLRHTLAALSRRQRRRSASMLAALVLLTGTSLATAGVLAAPARAWDTVECTSGVDCPGDPGGNSVSLDNGECLWDSCSDASSADGTTGEPDATDTCTGQACPDGQNPPVKNCDLSIDPVTGFLTCTVNAPAPTDPPPEDCTSTGDCPDPVTELPISPLTCAPADAGSSFFYNQDSFTSLSLTTDPFPTLDPVYNTACPPPPLPPPAPTQFGATDVALGDSFISGEGIGPFNVAVPGGGACDVADTAWPHLVYANGATAPVLASGSTRPFENWACTGATIANTANEITSALAAGKTDDNVTHNQFAGLGAATVRVQVSAGGNDLRFGPDLNCAYHTPLFVTPDDRHATDGSGARCVPDPAVIAPMINDLIPRLTALYQQISTGVPGVKVEAVSYPMLFPQGAAPVCGGRQTGVSRADQVTINDDTLLLDQAVRQAAKAAGAGFVDFSTALQGGATICDAPRGINLVGDTLTHTMGAFHPNIVGHQRLANSYLRQVFFQVPGASAAVPADGSVVADRAGDGVYVVAGGTLFPFANQAELSNSVYKGANIILEPPGQIAAQIAAAPKDGTLVKDGTTGNVYALTASGAKIALSPSPAQLPGIVVPSNAITSIPNLAPTVTLGGVTSGQTVSGTITLSATTSTPVNSVFYGITNQSTGVMSSVSASVNGPAPYSLALNTSALPNGTYQVFADTTLAGSQDGVSSTLTFTVKNGSPPPACGGPSDPCTPPPPPGSLGP